MAKEALSRRDAAALLVAGLAFAPSARAFDISHSESATRLSEPPYTPPPIQIEALWRRDLSESPPLEWLKACLRAAAAEL